MLGVGLHVPIQAKPRADGHSGFTKYRVDRESLMAHGLADVAEARLAGGIVCFLAGCGSQSATARKRCNESIHFAAADDFFIPK